MNDQHSVTAVPHPPLPAQALADALDHRPGGIDRLRQGLRAAREQINAQVFESASVRKLVHQHTALVDNLLKRVFRHFATGVDARVTLVAVGGYGRGELHPASDIDVLLLFEQEPDTAGKALAQKLVAFLWDAGLDIGHSVRSLDECVRQAAADVTVMTNLLEARWLAGDKGLLTELERLTDSEHMWPSASYFAAKRAEQQARHHRFHDAVSNLEPNVKDGPGGLRDIQTITWVLKRHCGAGTLGELVTLGYLTPGEFASLAEGQHFLWQVRFALHVLAGRHEDRLLFDHQRLLAERLGYVDDERRLGVEKFMRRYYRVITALRQLNEMLLGLFQEELLGAADESRAAPLNARFRALGNLLEVTSDGVFENHPSALMEMFLLLQQHEELEGVRASTIRLVRDHLWLVDDNFRNDPKVRGLFMEILRQPDRVNRELRRMHRYGVLSAYLPAFGAVSGQMQYDLFHVYTVDEHTLFVLRNVRAFADPATRERMPLACDLFERLRKPELLYIAALFHDIGKGRGGDHSELGADFVLRFCDDHGLSGYDARICEWLVRHHLLMSMTAQRRDISDPEVVSQFARTVGDRAHLDYLYLLTIADIRGTNPSLWNDWKDTLLKDLYQSTARALRRGLENPVDRQELIAETRTRAKELLGSAAGEHVESLWDSLGEDYFLRARPDEIAWHTQLILAAEEADLPLVRMRPGRASTEVFVYARDQECLFAASTTVLSRFGLNILGARIITADNGMTLDSFFVLGTDGRRIDEPLQERELVGALREQLHDPRHAPRRIRRRERRQLRHFAIPTRVNFEVDATGTRTLMEVIARDQPGLLANVGWAIADTGARLRNAHIATFGERAEDIFYVTDGNDGPLSDATTAILAEKIRAVLDTA